MELSIGDRINMYGKALIELIAIRRDVYTFCQVNMVTGQIADRFFHENMVAYRRNHIVERLDDGRWEIVR